MFNKKILSIICIICILIVGVGIYFCNNQTMTLDDYFDFSEKTNVSWNNNTNELTIQKTIPTKYNESYENVTVKIDFYKDSKYLNTSSITNNTTHNKLIINTVVKLDEKPNSYIFEIVNADSTETTVEAVKVANPIDFYL